MDNMKERIIDELRNTVFQPDAEVIGFFSVTIAKNTENDLVPTYTILMDKDKPYRIDTRAMQEALSQTNDVLRKGYQQREAARKG